MTEPFIQFKRLWTSLNHHAVELLMLYRNAGSAGRPIKFFAQTMGVPVSRVKSLVDEYPTLFENSGSRLRIADPARPYAQEFLTKANRQCDIHFLFDYLDDLEPAQWQTLFPFVSVTTSAGHRRWKQLMSVVEHIYFTPTRVREYIESLPVSDDHKAVFDLVYDSETGILTYDEIADAFDFHPAKLEHLLVELEQHALLFERYKTNKTKSPVRTYSLLKELMQFLAFQRQNEEKSSRHKLHALHKRPSDTADEELNLAYSVSCLIAHLRTHSLRITRDLAPHKTDLRKFIPLLNVPESSRINPQFVCDVARTVSLVEPDKDWTHLVLTDEAEQFSELAVLERQKRLFAVMAKSCGNGANTHEDAVALLAKLKQGAWYRLNDVIKYAEKQFMNGSRPAEEFTLRQHGPNWRFELSQERKVRLDSFRRYILEPLFIAGGVKLAPAGGRAKKVSITPLGRYLMGTAEPDDVDLLAASIEERALVVQPNFQIVVSDARFDPVHYATLDAFCSRNGNGRATVFQLDKHSVEHGIQTLGSVEPFIEFLEQHNKHGAIPANVASTLRGWNSGMKRLKVRRLGVIEADDDLVLMELMSRKKFKKYFSEEDKPAKFVVFASISTAKLKTMLEDEGYFVE